MMYIKVISSLVSICLVWFELVGINSNNKMPSLKIRPDQSVEDARNNQSREQQHEHKTRIQKIDHVDSPYEAIWPGEYLPSWAKKDVNFDVPAGEEVCFVHVGKAGGSAVGCSLGFSLHCADTVRVKGVLPKKATNTFHKMVYDCHDRSAYFLFVVRDPIDRVRSAFNYERPDLDCDDKDYLQRMARFYFDCPFYHFEEYVKNGLKVSGDASESCNRIARDALNGRLPYHRGPDHFYFNYHYYYKAVPQDAPILVIRNEHIEQDWNSVERLLGSNRDRLNPQVSFPRNNVNSWSSEEDLYLSPESILILCHALCNEILVYKKILGGAQNINEEQLQASLAELEAKCPIEAVADECPEPLPDISVKLDDHRGHTSQEEDS